MHAGAFWLLTWQCNPGGRRKFCTRLAAEGEREVALRAVALHGPAGLHVAQRRGRATRLAPCGCTRRSRGSPLQLSTHTQSGFRGVRHDTMHKRLSAFPSVPHITGKCVARGRSEETNQRREGGERADSEIDGEGVNRSCALRGEHGDEGRGCVRQARVHGQPPRVLAPGAPAHKRVHLRRRIIEKQI